MPKISDLNPTAFPSLDHFLAVAKDGETVRISVNQIRGLMKFLAAEINVDDTATVDQALTSLANLKADKSYVDAELNQKLDIDGGFLPDTTLFTDPDNATKTIRFDAGNVAAGQTRVLTMPNADVLISAFMATLLDDADAAAARATLLAVQRGGGTGQVSTAAVSLGPNAALTAMLVQAGSTNFGRIITESLMGGSFAASGFLRLPTPIRDWYIQWGTYSGGNDANVSFSAAFPTACRAVVATPRGVIDAVSSLSVIVDNLNPTGFSTRPRYMNNGGGVGVAVQGGTWIAVGD